MRKPSDAATEPAGTATPVLPADEFAGHGGAYEIDSTTGARRLVARTDPTPAAPDITHPAAAENTPKE